MIRVMIASPSDVPSERDIVRKAIHEWNDVNSADRSLSLMPMGWETNSSPEMHGRAQAIISKQILRDCDLLVAVFWTRLGSNTGVFASGTVEEIEEHLSAGKQAMIYFSSAPVVQSSVDHGQYAALLAFKETCKKRGLITEYESLSQFRELFSRHLSQTIIRQFARPDQNKFGTPTIVSRPALLRLSKEAEILLQAAAESGDNLITMLSTLDGITIRTQDTTFVEGGGDAREEAKWRSALQELASNHLVEDRSGRGEIFNIAQRGYDFADALGPYEPDQ